MALAVTVGEWAIVIEVFLHGPLSQQGLIRERYLDEGPVRGLFRHICLDENAFKLVYTHSLIKVCITALSSRSPQRFISNAILLVLRYFFDIAILSLLLSRSAVISMIIS